MIVLNIKIYVGFNFTDGNLIIITLILLISITIYEFSGMTVTRKVSATFRVVIEVIKVLFVWIFEICYYDAKQVTHENIGVYMMILLLKLIGYILIIFGNVLVNEIFNIRCCGLNKYYGTFIFLLAMRLT